MGRAIDTANEIVGLKQEITGLKQEIAQLKTAFNGLSATVESLQDTAPAKKNIDLHKETDTKNVRAEGKKLNKKNKTNKVIEKAEA